MSLKADDLKNTILPKISIDQFHPKAGTEEDVIVVAFYFRDQEPANDMNTFIQRGFIDTLDVDVSPSTDEDGHYLLFVEFERNKEFSGNFLSLLKDIKNVTGPVDWRITTQGSNGKEYSLADKGLFNTVITDPKEYKQRNRIAAEHTSVLESIFAASLVSQVSVSGNVLTLKTPGTTVIALVEDAGPHDVIMGRNFLSESAYSLTNAPYEARVIERMAGNVQTVAVGGYLCVYRDGNCALLSNTEVVY